MMKYALIARERPKSARKAMLKGEEEEEEAGGASALLLASFLAIDCTNPAEEEYYLDHYVRCKGFCCFPELKK